MDGKEPDRVKYKDHSKKTYSLKYKQKKWNKDDDNILIKLVQSYKTKIKWFEISKNFDKTTLQCYSRYRQINPILIKGKWNPKEDEQLKSLVKKHGKKWAFISKLIKNRSGKQIRDRYINCLDDKNLKRGFSLEEDAKIKELYNIHGPKWSIISKEFYGRTGDAIKNRYYWSIKPSLLNKYDKIIYSNRSRKRSELSIEISKKDISPFKPKTIFISQKVNSHFKAINSDVDSTASNANNFNFQGSILVINI